MEVRMELGGSVTDESWTRVARLSQTRWRVTVSLGGSPLAYVLHFTSSGGELVCDGVAIEQGNGEPVPVTGPAVRELAQRFARLERLARGSVQGLAENGEEFAVPAARTRRELTHEFLADVAARYNDYLAKGMGPTQSLARAEGVSPGTVKHWMRKAREIGIETGGQS